MDCVTKWLPQWACGKVSGLLFQTTVTIRLKTCERLLSYLDVEHVDKCKNDRVATYLVRVNRLTR